MFNHSFPSQDELRTQRHSIMGAPYVCVTAAVYCYGPTMGHTAYRVETIK